MTTAISITCPRCGATSWHPKDITEGYCAACHDFTQEPLLDDAVTPATNAALHAHRDVEPAPGVGATIAYRPMLCFPHVVRTVDSHRGVAYLWPLLTDAYQDTTGTPGGLQIRHHVYTATDLTDKQAPTGTLVRARRHHDGVWAAPHGHRVTFGLALYFASGRH